MLTRRQIASLALIVAIAGSLVSRPNAGEAPKDNGKQAIFPLSNEGEIVVVPVTIGESTHVFIVDTSCAGAICDRTLDRSGKASVGGFPLLLDDVGVTDLSGFREVSGLPIEGILGMEFLSRYVVELDFDKGELRIGERPTQIAGASAIPITMKNGCPLIPARIHETSVFPGRVAGTESLFIVDTGDSGGRSGKIPQHRFNAMHGKRCIDIVGQSLVRSMFSSDLTALDGRANGVTLGGFDVKHPVFSATEEDLFYGGKSTISLSLLSRFIATFDFPNRTLYLKKGANFEKADLWDLSGLRLLHSKGAIRVESVRPGSAAAKVSIKSDDVIVQVGSDKELPSIMRLRRILSTPGTITIAVERNGQLREVELRLEKEIRDI